MLQTKGDFAPKLCSARLQAEGITWDVEDFPDNTTILETGGGNGEAFREKNHVG